MITINQSYKELIKQVCQTAANRSAIQAFENVLIKTGEGTAEFKAGDSLIELAHVIPCEVKSGFETTVNASKFLQAFNACSGDATITVKDKMTIKSGKRKFTLPVIDAESYPAYPEMESEQVIDCECFIDNVKRAAWASGVNDARHVFNGVYAGKDAVATNGHKLSIVPLNADCEIIIPIESVKRLPDFTGRIYVSDSILCINSVTSVFKTKLVDGRYVDYNRAIPKCDKSVSVNVAEFKDAVKAAQITANSQFKTVVMSFGKESSIYSTSADRREDSSIGFECDSPEQFEFAVNSSYLIEALNEVTSETIDIKFSSGQMMIESDDSKSIISAVRV